MHFYSRWAKALFFYWQVFYPLLTLALVMVKSEDFLPQINAD
jgi:hypothetical protein